MRTPSRGSVKRTTPWAPGSAHMRPPWASTIARLIVSPIPMPLAFVVDERLEHALAVVRRDAGAVVADGRR